MTPTPDPWDAWRNRPGIPKDFQSFIAQFEKDFPDFFADFEREFARMNFMLEKVMEDATKHVSSPQRDQPFVYGFSMRIGKDGVPQLTPFGSAAQAGSTPIVESGEEIREPLSDVIEGEKEVSVTVELPGVEKSDLSLHVAQDALTVRVEKGPRRYHKKVRLPVKVVAQSAKATFKNGILDVTLQRKESGDGAGEPITIE